MTEELSTLIKLGRGRARICSQVFRSQSAGPITRPHRSEDEPQAAQATPWALWRLQDPLCREPPADPSETHPRPTPSIRVPCTYSNGCTEQTYNLTTCLIFDHFVWGPDLESSVQWGQGLKDDPVFRTLQLRRRNSPKSISANACTC